MVTNTGGPAYPTSNYSAIVPVSTGYSEGMALRDYFAAKAMAALYTSQYEYEFTGAAREPEFEALMNELAQDAYQMADAMLAAREQK